MALNNLNNKSLAAFIHNERIVLLLTTLQKNTAPKEAI